MSNECYCEKCGKVCQVYGSRWCAQCYYPGIDRDHKSMTLEGLLGAWYEQDVRPTLGAQPSSAEVRPNEKDGVEK